MRRRDFTFGVLLAAAGGTVQAQEPGKQHRIAIVMPSGSVSRASGSGGSRSYQAFFEELRPSAKSRDKTSPLTASREKAGPRVMPISLARWSAGTRT
jgi:hypothetical protein